MPKNDRVAMLILLTVLAQPVSAALKDAKPVFRSGNWTVLQSKDPMTDATTCVGIYKTNYGIQLSPHNLYITIRGGIQSVTLRFGDSPAKPMRLATEMEKKVHAIDIGGSDLNEVLESPRLRVEVLTLVSGVANEDLDMTGVKEVIENVRAGCPDSKSGTVASPKAEAQGCSDQMVAKLKAKGMKDTDIREVCDKQ
jgi:hypothetical protein